MVFMSDIKSKESRSRNMSAIKNKNTKPEIYLRQQLFRLGFRYRNNVPYLPGHPDIYLAKYNTAVFINGCFWHRHKGCKFAYTPKSNVAFWEKKFRNNTERDAVVKNELKKAHIKCVIVWECTIKSMQKDDQIRNEVLKSLVEFFCENNLYLEM